MRPDQTQVQYLKLDNGESVISRCSDLMTDEGLYVLYFPFKYNSVRSPGGAVVNTQLTPWIQCDNQGPISIPSSRVMVKLDPAQFEIDAYDELVKKCIEAKKSNNTKGRKKGLAKKKEKPDLKVISFNDGIATSRSKARLDLVYDDQEIRDEIDDTNVIFINKDDESNE